MTACFLSPLDCTLVDDRDGLWRLDAPLAFFSEVAGQRIEVPAGFTTDFASVPRIPLVYMLYGDRNRKAATIHDYLYRHQIFDRATCDAVFREAMRADGEGFMVSFAMWFGVRLGGAFTYDN